MTPEIEEVMKAFDKVHLAQVDGGWQLSVQRKGQAGWLVSFGKTIQGAIDAGVFGRSDPGEPVFEEDPLS